MPLTSTCDFAYVSVLSDFLSVKSSDKQIWILRFYTAVKEKKVTFQ